MLNEDRRALGQEEIRYWPKADGALDEECERRKLCDPVCDRCGIRKTSGHRCGSCGEDV